MIYRTVIVFFLLVGFGNHVFSQVSNSSFSKVQKRSSNSSYSLLIDSANTYLYKDASKAIGYLEKALAISLQEGNTTNERQCYFLLGKANYNLKLYDQALRYFQKATIADKLGNTRGGEGYSASALLQATALAYEAKGDYINAEKKVSELRRDKAFISSVDNNAWLNNFNGRLAYKQGKTAEASAYFNAVVNQEKLISNQQLVIEANDYLAKMASGNSKSKAAKELYKKSLKVAADAKDEDLYLEQEKKLKEEYAKDKEFDKIISLNNSTAIPRTDSIVILNKIENANAYISSQKADVAIPILEKNLVEVRKQKMVEAEAETFKALSKAYEQKGDYVKAASNYKKFVALQDSVFKLKEKELITANVLRDDAQAANQRIEVLQKDREINDHLIESLEKDKEYQRSIIYGLIGFILVVILSFYLLYRNVQQKKLANQMLALKSLRSQMNPHFIFNALNSVNSFISSNDQRTANKYLADFSKLMRAVLENSEKDFVPLNEEIEVLSLYVKLEHHRFNNKFDYEIEVDPSLVVDSYKVPPMLIQPYLENAVWHGLRYKEEKGFLKVNISANNNAVVVLIEDNGIGRTKSQELKTKCYRIQQLCY
ncbi:MAG: histidine kinase [Flavobacteriales bacterium]